MSFARITGTGGYLPEKVLTNQDLEKIVDTTDQWIRYRTGIEKRHIALEGQNTVDLAERASRLAIEMAGLKPQEIDLIVVATTTPDRIFPSTACLLQSRLDIHGCAAFDIQAVCTGPIEPARGLFHRAKTRSRYTLGPRLDQAPSSGF